MGNLTHTLSGSIVNVRSPAVASIDNFKIHFSPVQEGSDNPSPENVRPITGKTEISATKVKSIWDGRYEKGYIKSNGESISSSDTFMNIGYIDVKPNSKIKFRFTRTNISAANIHLFYYNENKEYITDRWVGPDGDINISANTKYIRFQMDTAYTRTYDGNDLTVFYSNEAEIVPVTLPNFSTNLFDSTNEELVYVSKNNEIYTNTDVDTRTYAQFEIQLYNGTTLLSTISPYSFTGTGTMSYEFSINEPLCNTLVFKHNGLVKDFRIRFPFTYGNGVYTISCNVIKNDPTTINGLQLTNILIKRGSKDFVDYTNNTIYGGYIDLATGQVFAEYGHYLSDGSKADDWSSNDYTEMKRWVLGAAKLTPGTPKASSTNNLKTNYLLSSSAAYPWYAFIGSTSNFLCFTPNDTISNKTAWLTYLSEHPLDIVYELATPKLVATLTPQELTTFRGITSIWSDSGNVDITFNIVESSDMIESRKRIFAGSAPTIHTSSGSVVTFNMETGLNRNLTSCKVGFLPVQEGSGDPFPPINQNGSIVGVNNTHNESELSSFKIHFSPIQLGAGDPSPTNVRPITGWTGVTGYKSGKNLLEYPVFWLQAGLSPVHENTFFIKAGTYKLSLSIANATKWRIGILTKTLNGELTGQDNEYLPVIDNMNLGWYTHHWGQVSDNQKTEYTVIIPKDCYIRFMLHSGDTSANTTIANGQLEAGSTVTSYESYSAPTSYSVSWESQGTLYGGYVDLVSGDVVKTCGIVDDLSTLYWSDNGSDTKYNFQEYISVDLANIIAKTANGDDKYCIACSKYKTMDRTTQWRERIPNTIASTSGGQIRIYSEGIDTFATNQEFRESLLGVALVYQLATPVIVTTLTPTQIALISGKSTYWSDADSVTIETEGNVRDIYPMGGFAQIYKRNTNLFTPFYKGTGVSSNTGEQTQSATHATTDYIPITFSNDIQSYYLGGLTYRLMSYICAYNKDKAFVGRTVGTDRSYAVLTKDSFYLGQESAKHTGDIAYIRIDHYKGNSQYEIDEIDSITPFLNIGNSALPYEPPYIESVGVPFVLGKNLFDEKYPDIETSGDIYQLHYRHYYVGNGAVYASSNMPRNGNGNGNLFVLPGITLSGAGTNVNDINMYHSRIITPINGYITFAYRLTAGVDPRDYPVMIERATQEQVEPSPYEPMNALYGGYVDLVTGEVVKEWDIVSLKKLSWYNFSANIMFAADIHKVKQSDIYSTHYAIEKNTNPQIEQDLSCYNSSASYASAIYFRKEGMSNPTDLINWFNSLPYDPVVIYKLQNPVVVGTLTPTQVQVLRGTNNIFSDANGIIEVKYWSH